MSAWITGNRWCKLHSFPSDLKIKRAPYEVEAIERSVPIGMPFTQDVICVIKLDHEKSGKAMCKQSPYLYIIELSLVFTNQSYK